MIHQLSLKYLPIVQQNEGINIFLFISYIYILSVSSGLTEGDHIVYVDSQNVQNFRSFDDIIHLIQRTFEKYGQVTLVTLTNAGYHVLRKRGGYLESIAFDYQSSNIDQLKPRLCQLKLYNHEYDFGFTLQTNDYLSVKNIEEYSSADTSGLRKDDIILEINGRATKYLTIDQIKKIIETSKQERKLDLLVIDPNGYRFSIRHAIPLNSLLPIVQTGDKQSRKKNSKIYKKIFFFFFSYNIESSSFT